VILLSLLLGVPGIVLLLLAAFYLFLKLNNNNTNVDNTYQSKNFNHFIDTLKKIEQEDNNQ
jgi:YbbR domain-containing protein